ncbi:MAG: sugar phosphate isomerase/epimerase [Pirellulaceae bacterium]|nr:sugar phosphate isomerase/epimerase [Pirellulaceae bacterium]
MISSTNPGRRRFLQGAAAVALAQPWLNSLAAEPAAPTLAGRVYKTLKVGMVSVPGSLQDKFQAVKDAGFDGIELNAPGIDIAAAKQAILATGLPVDGSVGGTHWKIRHTSASADERAQALRDLQQALRETRAVGGHSVLVVVGHGQDGSESEIWQRSVENIAQALPLAAELGVYIVIENVWNHFLYDHAGGADQTAEKFIRYVDEFNSPWVGMQFDVGNHWKYGSMGDWIRALGKRVVKLDLKGYSRQADKFTKIGEGDVDWADVRRALIEIGYTGWAAAEVAGGGPDRLREIAANMDRVLGLKS